ncbi:MAG: 4Fe-4S ferredoxin, partial [Firmicutes bacterium]|nr:4Fe-4S ferredoxin [Bacillota bacterium]
MKRKAVYFTNFRTKPGLSMLDKLEKLVRKAGIGEIDFNGKFTAVKIHFGEPGNLA